MSDLPAAPPAPSRLAALRAIVWGGVLCGTCDLAFAVLYYGNKGASPTAICQSIAGGVLGRATYSGGAQSAALGIVLHYVISFILAALYVRASRRLPVLLARAVLCGLLYGVAVYYVMNMVVLPLSALRTSAWPPPANFPSIVAHAVGVGLTIALAARFFLRPRGSL